MDALGVLNLAQAGDARAEKIVQHRAGIVSDIIVNLSLILNPGLILLEGEVGSHPTPVSYTHLDVYKRQWYPTLRKKREGWGTRGFVALSAEDKKCPFHTPRVGNAGGRL